MNIFANPFLQLFLLAVNMFFSGIHFTRKETRWGFVFLFTAGISALFVSRGLVT